MGHEGINPSPSLETFGISIQTSEAAPLGLSPIWHLTVAFRQMPAPSACQCELAMTVLDGLTHSNVLHEHAYPCRASWRLEQMPIPMNFWFLPDMALASVLQKQMALYFYILK